MTHNYLAIMRFIKNEMIINILDIDRSKIKNILSATY